MRHKHSVTEDPVKLAGITAIAAAVGAAVAMLVTPRNGGEVRRGLKRRAQNAAHEVHDRFEHSVNEVGDTTDDVKDQLQSAAEKAATKTRSTTKEAASEAKSDAKTVKRQANK